MINRVLCILIVLLHAFIFCQSQVLNYECNFNDAMTNDCLFTSTSGAPNMGQEIGPYPGTAPRQPLSDASAVLSLTKPNNEPCVLPYPYPPAGTWQMHFCRRNFNGTFTCPTASSSGQCVAGKYGVIKIPTTGSSDYTYMAIVQRSSNIVQCLDFYYYITDTSENAKMQVGWESDEDLDDIVEVTAVPSENKWQHIQRSFTLASSLSSYKISFRMMRNNGIANFFFALDEIKVYDQSCDSLPAPTVPTTTTPEIVIGTTTTTTILPGITTAEPITTPVTSPAISTQSSKPDEITSTTNTPIVQPITTTTANSQSITTTLSVEETSSTQTPTETTTTTTESLILTSTTITTVSTPTITSTVTITTTTTTITAEPLTRIFSCDFSTKLCFEDTELIVTNGTEFTPVDISEPPRAPLSDVNSIYQPTTNTEICKLPYQPLIGNIATSWNMWFCYNNQCPTESEQLSTCTSGDYGLISLDPWESNKTISSSISPSIMTRESVEEQCLLYYYYFTVYDGLDWGQQLSVSIISDNETNNAVEIDRVSVSDMIDNRWYQRNVTFNSTFTNYTLIFIFEVTNANRTEDVALNKTIYFALDNIDVYNRNCDDVIDPFTTTITTSTTSATPTPTTTETTTTGNETTNGTLSTSSSNLGLILGLALGVGIPVSLALIGGIVYYFKVIKPKHRVLVNNSTATTTAIPMAPMSASTNENATVAALVA